MVGILNWAKQVLSGRRRGPSRAFVDLFKTFKDILALNNRALELMSEASDKLSGDYVFDQQYIHTATREILDTVEKLVMLLDSIAPGKYYQLFSSFYRIKGEIEDELSGERSRCIIEFILPYSEVNRDLVDTVGGKNANLAEIMNNLGLRVPPGFAITTAAYEAFLEYNGLKQLVEDTCREWTRGKIGLEDACRSIQERILSGGLPPKLKNDLKKAVDQFITGRSQSRPFLSLRSSAVGEDSEHSFAGQYKSLLNLSPSELEDGYKEVVASLFGERAMAYRHHIGFKQHEVAMSVACQRTIHPVTSGVVYTMDPAAPGGDSLIVSATWGLGIPVVSGTAETDRFFLSRHVPHEVISVDIVRKEKKVMPARHGGVEAVDVQEHLQTLPCLSNEQLHELASTAMLIEKYFKRPQDIEFAIDEDGRLVILQARQLNIEHREVAEPGKLVGLDRKYKVLMQGKGIIVQEGIGTGPVYQVRSEKDLKNFPNGAVLVAKFPSPILAKVLARASALLTDVGSETGHLATVAREFRVPAVFNMGDVTSVLPNGIDITVDAEENVIYEGIVKELQHYGLTEEPIEETYEYRLLRRVLKKIEPLHLLDPSESNFTPEACQTLHDITRFVHEKTVEELINFHYYNQHDPSARTHKLVWDVPLDLVIIDIGGGLAPGAGRDIAVDEVLSVPMQPMLKALSKPGVWSREPMPVDFGSFMSSLTRTFSPELANPRFVGQNLAVISDQYANLSLRLGYHFTMIDTYVSETINDNYIYFRFFGGVTDDTRRSRRARFLGEVLERNDFRVEIKGDLVVGRLKKINKDRMLRRLYILGLLIGFTRQLDVQMVGDQSIYEYLETFNRLYLQQADGGIQ